MMDMSESIKPVTDQLTADDCLAGPVTIKITKVTGNEGNAAQPVNIHFEGDNGKPYRPAKIMRRVLVSVYGPDTSKYIGQSITLYRDPEVRFGGIACGGLRISHVTGIDKVHVLALTMSKGNKKPFQVKPLVLSEPQRQDTKPADASTGISKREFAVRLRELITHGTVASANEYWAANEAVRAQLPDDKILEMENALADMVEPVK